jgi:hypothetical protein
MLAVDPGGSFPATAAAGVEQGTMARGLVAMDYGQRYFVRGVVMSGIKG